MPFSIQNPPSQAHPSTTRSSPLLTLAHIRAIASYADTPPSDPDLSPKRLLLDAAHRTGSFLYRGESPIVGGFPHGGEGVGGPRAVKETPDLLDDRESCAENCHIRPFPGHVDYALDSPVIFGAMRFVPGRFDLRVLITLPVSCSCVSAQKRTIVLLRRNTSELSIA